jgi:phage shock protein C
MIQKILTFFERQTFGVCNWWGEKLGISSSRIRLFFVYASFLSFGSPLIVYLMMAFILNIRNYIRSKRNRVWDL